MTYSQYERTRRTDHDLGLDLLDTLGALSYALDMTEGQPPGHTLRTAWIGMQIGRALNLPAPELGDLLMVLLLKDVGCSSNAAKLAHLFVTDDIGFKREFKTRSTTRDRLQLILRRAAPDAGFLRRLLAYARVVGQTRRLGQDLIATRCERGAAIAHQLGAPEMVQNGIRMLDEHWDGSGAPNGLRGPAIPRLANIALMAQLAEVHHADQGATAALGAITARAGTWFDPALVRAFTLAAADPAFWSALSDYDMSRRIFRHAPPLLSAQNPSAQADAVAVAFAQVVDAKSPFTLHHSKRVAFYAELIAGEIGCDLSHRQWINRAALLHDLGKLAISNRILDKPDALDPDEWSTIKSYPIHTERILRHSTAFADIAPVCGTHRERLDGMGYPYGLSSDDISLETRIITVADVFDALSAQRPHRPALSSHDAIELMQNDIGTAIDEDCLFALRSGLRKLKRRAA